MWTKPDCIHLYPARHKKQVATYAKTHYLCLMQKTKFKVLLVDDDAAVLDFLSYNLVKKQFEVQTATNGLDAFNMGLSFRPDIIILDWMMPQINGLEACKKFRENPLFDDTIITFMTANDDDFSRIEGFKAGADDYIHKSIKPVVFVAKIEALLRRKQINRPVKETIQLFDLTIFPQKRLVKKTGNKVALTKIEFDLLMLFLSNPHKIFSRQEIYDTIWGQEIIVGDRTLDVHILNLRKKIGKKVIQTTKGVGYTIGEARF
ncbi:MAG TPA: response regulator transcription factor [Saprospiraceae bacterium]|nr:response regulator transcription factor [Saprospiraceae bacterium]